MSNITTKSVISSNISAIGYDEVTKTLKVVFKGGKAYLYDNVPVTVWNEFNKTPSIGLFFYSSIKNSYPFVKE